MANVLFWSDRALKEYDQLLDYLLEEWSETITLRISLEIDETINRIKNSPEQFPIIVKSRKIRRCVASSQTSIYFKANKDAIVIMSLYDNRRNPKKRKL
jgi:plasmid stabilization system protein ParE